MNDNFKVHTSGSRSVIKIRQMYGRENCFSVTGNLIIVIECNIGAFFKRNNGAHLRITRLQMG